ncbi:MAG: Gfo/Idh/MocA family oxidoreductase, partial [Chloroflexi bacterium]|nr:Gfo/Idh/MocA family oxidoreductase [Chloroflexota bacterium]
MSDSKVFGVGVVGLDHWYAGIGAVDELRHNPRAKVVAVAHRDEEKLREFASERGIPAATTDYHAVAQMPEVDAVATVEVTWTGQPGISSNLTQLVGTDGQVAFDAALTGKLAVAGQKFETPAESGWTLFNPPARRGGGMVSHLIECLASGVRPVATFDDSRANLAACLAFYEAARFGKAV